MRLEQGCLKMEPLDLDMILSDINVGLGVKEAFEKQVTLSDINIMNIYDIQAFAKDLAPYEKLILSILQLL